MSLGGVLNHITQTRSDVFDATGNGVTVDCADIACTNFALQVTKTGSVTSWTVVLEGSLDGVTFTTLLTHTNASPGDGLDSFSTTPTPVLYFRSRCHAITLDAGVSITAKIVGVR